MNHNYDFSSNFFFALNSKTNRIIFRSFEKQTETVIEGRHCLLGIRQITGRTILFNRKNTTVVLTKPDDTSQKKELSHLETNFSTNPLMLTN